jgi:hypothetical protein
LLSEGCILHPLSYFTLYTTGFKEQGMLTGHALVTMVTTFLIKGMAFGDRRATVYFS